VVEWILMNFGLLILQKTKGIISLVTIQLNCFQDDWVSALDGETGAI